MIDVRKLRMLAALQRLGTIAAVADELHLSPPGVSMQLTGLEKELGLQLTQRQGRRVTLTPAGSLLAAHGHDIIDRISLAELELNALRAGTVGHYTVTAFPSAGRTFLADACRHVIGDDGCALELRITTSEPEAALDALSSGAVDLAVIHSYSNVPRDVPAGLATRTIGTEPVWLATRKPDRPGDGEPSTRLEDYAESPWIAATDDVTCFDMVERACGLAGFRPQIVAESLDFSVQLALVAAGVGVALVPDLTVETLPDGVDLLTPSTPIERTIFIAARAPRFNDPGIHNLAAIIEESAAARLTAPRQPR
ncbi:LysR family transcriptional regulator [Streptomyces longhuiensis]|uniref:LysR family transcriptional regulator n=1 Tax=Streptomyces TaxID=1883 RepID=UPI001D09A509|nr:LysR family transcriptional regulator [Streptomyces longhuiensis]UDL97144.1 LysR family transcriptional regulator [Streptomyces longhuiensis]